MTTTTTTPAQALRDALALARIREGERFEVASRNRRGLRGQLFEDLEAAARWLGRGPDRYVGLSPLRPDAAPRRGRPEDEHVLEVRTLLVDVDPKGVSPAARAGALAAATEVRRILSARLGVAPPVVDSGRGIQIWLAHEPHAPDERARRIRQRTLVALAALADVEGAVKVDVRVYNASRVARLPGPWWPNSRTGDLPRIASRGDGREVSLAALDRFADEVLGPADAPPSNGTRPRPTNGERVDVYERAQRYLREADPAVSGSGGHATAMRVVGAVVRGFDLDDAGALDALREWNARCEPPWSERELAHKVSEAQKTDDPQGRARGWLLGDRPPAPARSRPAPSRSGPPPQRPAPAQGCSLEEADRRLEGLLARAIGDAGVLHDQDVIEALAVLRRDAAPRWKALKAQLVAARVGGVRELGVAVRELAARWQAAEQATARRESEAQLRRDRGAVFHATEELALLVPAVWTRLLALERERRSLYLRLGMLARVREAGADQPVIELLKEDDAHGLVFRAGAWVKVRTDGELAPAKPTRDIGRDLLANPHQAIPELEGIIRAPCYAPGWRLVAAPGYDPEAKLELRLGRDLAEVGHVPARPSEQERADALALLDDLLCDFPWARPSDRAHALGALILPFVRRAIDGATPLHDLEAPMPGSGKTLLADVISRIAAGAPLAVTILPRNGDEARKQISALLVAGVELICWDNVEVNQLGELAAAVTSETWQDRELGATKLLTVPNRSVWCMTANNPKLSAEIARRCVRVRIEPAVDVPEEREGFRHPDLRGYVMRHRAQLVRAVLVLVQAWLAAGRPYGGRIVGSFEPYCCAIGGILEVAGVEGFLEDRELLADRADTESAELRDFIDAWASELAPGAHAVGDLADFAERQGLLASLLERCDTQRSRTTKLGKTLTRNEGRIFSGRRLARARDARAKRRLWLLEPVGGSAGSATEPYRAEPAEPAEPVSGSRSERDLFV